MRMYFLSLFLSDYSLLSNIFSLISSMYSLSHTHLLPLLICLHLIIHFSSLLTPYLLALTPPLIHMCCFFSVHSLFLSCASPYLSLPFKLNSLFLAHLFLLIRVCYLSLFHVFTLSRVTITYLSLRSL
jgi:hypothetical protein